MSSTHWKQYIDIAKRLGFQKATIIKRANYMPLACTSQADIAKAWKDGDEQINENQEILDDWADTKKQLFRFYEKTFNIILRDDEDGSFLIAQKNHEICIARQFKEIWFILYGVSTKKGQQNNDNKKYFQSPVDAFTKACNNIFDKIEKTKINYKKLDALKPLKTNTQKQSGKLDRWIVSGHNVSIYKHIVRLTDKGKCSAFGEAVVVSGKVEWDLAIELESFGDIHIGIYRQNLQDAQNTNMLPTEDRFTYTSNSYGYANKTGAFIFNGQQKKYGQRYREGDKITVRLDLESRTLLFLINDESQGIAYEGLPKGAYRLAVSMQLKHQKVWITRFSASISKHATTQQTECKETEINNVDDVSNNNEQLQQIKQLQSTIIALEKKLKALELETRSTKQEHKQNQKTMKKQLKEIQKLQSTITSTENKLEATKQQHQQFINKLTKENKNKEKRYKDEIETLTKNKQQLQSELSQERQKSVQMEQMMNKLQDEINLLQQQEEKHDDEAVGLKNVLIALADKMNEFNTTFDKNMLSRMYNKDPELLLVEDDILNTELSHKSFGKHLQDVKNYVLSVTKPDVNKYKSWDINIAIMWIKSLDNGQFIKYCDILRKAFETDGITGEDLPNISQSDLRDEPFKIQLFKDRKRLAQHFKSLEQNEIAIANMDDEGGQTQYIG